MKQIALEGPINACSDVECKTWREVVVAELSNTFKFHNPMDFDCRGKEKELEADLIAFDTKGITASDIILVMADKPGWGTAMAVQMAWAMHKQIVTICPSDKPSPWLRNRSTIMTRTLADALVILKGIA